MEFLGYERPDGSYGARNHVLILPASRLANMAAHAVCSMVAGTKTVLTTGELGRPKGDRERLARLLAGLARNPNVAATVIIGVKRGYGYPEVREDALAEEIAKSGKPLEIVTMDREGGYHRTVAKAVEIARRFVLDASRLRRVPAPAGKLTVGVKCGMSDATSGIAGNPVFGRAMDMLVDHGGTFIFSETTEVIGAEDLLAERAASPSVAEKLLAAVENIESKAKSVGEDIRSINPIPSNIAAGLSTLEEKSLGAIAKSGSRPIQGVLRWAERPPASGVYFMDGWMSAYSLPPALAAAGAQITVYQLGGDDLPEIDPPMPGINTAVVAPLLMITGNPRTEAKAPSSIDFSSGAVVLGKEGIEEAASRLFQKILSVASGELSKGETWNYQDPVEPYYDGPFF